MLAENVEGIANATETVEMLNQAQENLQEVAKNPASHTGRYVAKYLK